MYYNTIQTQNFRIFMEYFIYHSSFRVHPLHVISSFMKREESTNKIKYCQITHDKFRWVKTLYLLSRIE